MLDILKSYNFLVIAMGTMLLAFTSAMVGCISLHKGQSLIGDAIGHSAFPGVVLAFIFFRTRNPLILSLGAMVAGGISYFLIQFISNHSKIRFDASLAVFLSGFFGLGMVLKSYTQGNPKFVNASQSGLQNYIFGQAAYIMEADIRVIFTVSLFVLGLFVLFYKEYKLFLFDEEYAKTMGFPPKFMYFLLLIMIISLISVGLKLVGSILISSLLIFPVVTANQWSNDFGKVLWIAAISAMISAFIGTWLSSVFVGMSTGPAIICVMGIVALLSLLVSPKGILASLQRRRSL